MCSFVTDSDMNDEKEIHISHILLFYNVTIFWVICWYKKYFFFGGFAFSTLTLLIGYQEEHVACKSVCWHDYLSGVRCKLFAYGPADATATPSSLASLKSRIVLPFWYRLTQIVLEKRLLNRCLSVCWYRNLGTCQYCRSFPRESVYRERLFGVVICPIWGEWFCLLQCFDTVAWPTGRASGL